MWEPSESFATFLRGGGFYLSVWYCAIFTPPPHGTPARCTLQTEDGAVPFVTTSCAVEYYCLAKREERLLNILFDFLLFAYANFVAQFLSHLKQSPFLRG